MVLIYSSHAELFVKYSATVLSNYIHITVSLYIKYTHEDNDYAKYQLSDFPHQSSPTRPRHCWCICVCVYERPAISAVLGDESVCPGSSVTYKLVLAATSFSGREKYAPNIFHNIVSACRTNTSIAEGILKVPSQFESIENMMSCLLVS